MSEKENNNKTNIYPFSAMKLPKKDSFQLFVFDKYSEKNIGLVKGNDKNDCLAQAHELFDPFEFSFSFNEENKLKIKKFKTPKYLYIFHEKTKEHCNTIVGESKKDCWNLAGELLNDDLFDATFNPRFGRINGLEYTQTNCFLFA